MSVIIWRTTGRSGGVSAWLLVTTVKSLGSTGTLGGAARVGAVGRLLATAWQRRVFGAARAPAGAARRQYQPAAAASGVRGWGR